MIRVVALAAVATLLLSGCFLFDNPFDTSSTPTATFQVVVKGPSLAGTYVWSSPDNAYRTVIDGTPYFVYLDSEGGTWGVRWSVSPNAFSTSPAFGALPPTSGSNWLPGGEIWSVDSSAGGISAQGQSPESIVTNGNTLLVAFKASDPRNSATYAWERSDAAAFLSVSAVGTGIPQYLTSGADAGKWIRVRVTPADSTGTYTGTPVVSQPVKVF